MAKKVERLMIDPMMSRKIAASGSARLVPCCRKARSLEEELAAFEFHELKPGPRSPVEALTCRFTNKCASQE